MSKKSRKAERQLAIQREIERRIQRRKEISPIDREQMLSLIEFVGRSIVERIDPGDGSFMGTWCAQNNVPYEEMKVFLATEDISDDWSLLMDGDPYRLFGSSDTRHVWMPLEQPQLDELLDWLDEKLSQTPCDHTHVQTREWLEDKPVDATTVIAALLTKGGMCDCEVLYNVDTDGIYPKAPSNLSS